MERLHYQVMLIAARRHGVFDSDFFWRCSSARIDPSMSTKWHGIGPVVLNRNNWEMIALKLH